MRPSCHLMAGSLSSIGRLARPRPPPPPRRSGSKRRRLDEPPLPTGPSDEERGGEDDEGLAVGVGPFGTCHDADLGDNAVAMPGAPRRHELVGVCKNWWPLVGVAMELPAPPPHRTPVQGTAPSSSRTVAAGASAPARAARRRHIEAEDGRFDSSTPSQGEQDWSQLPEEALVEIFRLLRLQDLGRCAQVCRGWRRATQEPCLWRTAEFVLSGSISPGRPERMPPALVNFILEEHAQHLKFVVLRTDSSAESARAACRILARLVNCSLKTLALMSGAARPSLLDAEEQQFASALTLVLDHSSPSLRALAVDHTLVDDPALQALAGVGSGSLQLLRCKSCPRLSPGGVLALVDHCRRLRELSLSYTLLSDDLLNALSSERHVCLEVLRVDVYTDADTALRPIAPSSWRALVRHSPQLNLVMYLFAIQDESFDHLFTSYIPVTHLYFGDYVPTSVLSRVGAFCPRLVELVVGDNGNAVIDKQLLDVAANCEQLSSLGLAECQVTCSALLHLAGACGPRLSQLVVMEECLIEDEAGHDLASTCAAVSRLLGRDWSPEFMPMW